MIKQSLFNGDERQQSAHPAVAFRQVLMQNLKGPIALLCKRRYNILQLRIPWN